MRNKNHKTVQCSCGNVEIDVVGAPILGATCYCDDCQEGARQIGALEGASALMDEDGGTELLLFRKDRVQCLKGSDHLQDFRIKDDSPTRRVVATCCNTAMFLDFQKGHWFSIYRGRFGDQAPPIQVRIQTKYRPGNGSVDNPVPDYKSYPLTFIAKLLAARIGMLLGR